MLRYPLFLILASALLAGCGTKGPLFLPAPPNAAAPGATVIADHSSAGTAPCRRAG